MAKGHAAELANDIRASAEVSGQVDVYTSGTDGYARFRIPAIVATTSGTLLAFAEGRVNSGADTGNIDLVLRRSFDGGKTWGPLQVVWDDGENTCGNPAPVVDRNTGRVILLSTWNHGHDHEKDIWAGTSKDTRRVFVCHSDDDGATFSRPRQITAETKKNEWRWYATGPGHGIQLRNGTLVIPANHTIALADNTPALYSHVIFSEDGGDTWELGGRTGDQTNESSVMELDDGQLMLNSRSYHGFNCRAISLSSDGGRTWLGPFLHPDLIEPVCQASTLKVKHNGQSVYLFSNPKSKERENVTVRKSTDEGSSWSKGVLLHQGFGAYSDLADLGGGYVGCLFERGHNGSRYSHITFCRLPVD